MHIVMSMEKPGISQGWQHFPFDPQAIPAVLLGKHPKALKAFNLRLRCTILLRSISHDWEFSASLCVGTATLLHRRKLDRLRWLWLMAFCLKRQTTSPMIG